MSKDDNSIGDGLIGLGFLFFEALFNVISIIGTIVIALGKILFDALHQTTVEAKKKRDAAKEEKERVENESKSA